MPAGRNGNEIIDVIGAELEAIELSPEQRLIAGECRLSELVLDTSPDGRSERGIWEVTEGVLEDVESDEVFVVVTGRATIQYLDDGTSFEAEAGHLGFTEAGTRTRWTVHETVRKVYQVNLDPSD